MHFRKAMLHPHPWNGDFLVQKVHDGLLAQSHGVWMGMVCEVRENG